MLPLPITGRGLSSVRQSLRGGDGGWGVRGGTTTDPPANVPAVGRVPRPVEVVAGDRARRQGEKGPKRRFWSLSGEQWGYKAPKMRHRTAHWVR